MNINVRSRKVEVTQAMREYAEKRLVKFDKMLGGVEEVSVLHNVAKDTHTVEVTMHVDNVILRGETSSDSMYSCIDMVVEKLERQVRKHKTKLGKRFREDAGKRELQITEMPIEESEVELVKTKTFERKPYMVEDAIMQMELLGHDFFAFINAETNEISVIYKRKDGNIGMLQPE